MKKLLKKGFKVVGKGLGLAKGMLTDTFNAYTGRKGHDAAALCKVSLYSGGLAAATIGASIAFPPVGLGVILMASVLGAISGTTAVFSKRSFKTDEQMMYPFHPEKWEQPAPPQKKPGNNDKSNKPGPTI